VRFAVLVAIVKAANFIGATLLISFFLTVRFAAFAKELDEAASTRHLGTSMPSRGASTPSPPSPSLVHMYFAKIPSTIFLATAFCDAKNK
jgi:hypothetical protein